MITMIDVGITVPGKNQYDLWLSQVPFHKAFLSVTNIVFAYGKSESTCAKILVANCFVTSWPRLVLQLYQRVQESQRLSQSAFSTANLRHFNVRCRGGCRLPLYGQQGTISRP